MGLDPTRCWKVGTLSGISPWSLATPILEKEWPQHFRDAVNQWKHRLNRDLLLRFFQSLYEWTKTPGDLQVSVSACCFCFGLWQVTSCTPAMEMCSPSRRRKLLPPIWTLLSAPEHAEKATRYGTSENQWKCRNGAPYNLFEIQEVSFCEDLSAKLVFFILHFSWRTTMQNW